MYHNVANIICVVTIYSFAYVHAQSPGNLQAQIPMIRPPNILRVQAEVPPSVLTSSPNATPYAEPQSPGALLNFLKENNVSNLHQEPVLCPSIHLMHTEIFLSEDNCRDLNIDVPLSEIKGKAKVQGKFCFKATDDWKVSIHIDTALFGINLFHDDYNFYPGHNEVSQGVDAKVVSLRITVGVYDNCLKLKGTGSYNVWFKKDSGSFDVTVHCF